MINIYYRSIRDKGVVSVAKTQKGCWVNVVTQDKNEAIKIAKRFDLDQGLVLDGIDLYEAPRVEHEEGNIYIYVRYCNPDSITTSTEPLLIIIKPDMLITIARQPVGALQAVVDQPETTTTQKLKLSLQILSAINVGYHGYINNITKKIFATRTRLGNRKTIHNNDILFLIDLEEDLNEFLATLQPYDMLLQALLGGRYLDLYADDKDLITDLQLSTGELIELSKSRLKTMQNIREAYTTIATNNLNRLFRLLTSISIFLMIPTLVFSFYGMNVSLPLASSSIAVPIILIICAILVAGTIYTFRRKNWF